MRKDLGLGHDVKLRDRWEGSLNNKIYYNLEGTEFVILC
jgi:hypothetical protein